MEVANSGGKFDHLDLIQTIEAEGWEIDAMINSTLDNSPYNFTFRFSPRQPLSHFQSCCDNAVHFSFWRQGS